MSSDADDARAGGESAVSAGAVLTASGDCDGLRWIEAAERDGATPDEALAAFDRFAPVSLASMRGRWRGGGLHTGHPLDGMLEAAGWYGKAFVDNETVFPLLFRGRRGGIIPLDPKWLPIGLAARLHVQRSPLAMAAFRLGKGVIATHKPGARLRMTAYRGVTTATMIYDAQPINDLFRQVAPGVLLGLMDCRGLPPMFFTLRRDDDQSVPVAGHEFRP